LPKPDVIFTHLTAVGEVSCASYYSQHTIMTFIRLSRTAFL